MLRKQIIKPSAAPAPMPGRIDVAAVATVLVTSEDADHPVDHAFDSRSGPGNPMGRRGTGRAVLILAFDAPQSIRRVLLEVEEREVARTQEIQLAVSGDGGLAYRELLARNTTSARRARPSSGRIGRWRPRECPTCGW